MDVLRLSPLRGICCFVSARAGASAEAKSVPTEKPENTTIEIFGESTGQAVLVRFILCRSRAHFR